MKIYLLVIICFKFFLELFEKHPSYEQKINKMETFIERGNFKSYTIFWQECSCSGKNSLIHHLNRREKVFAGVVSINYHKKIKGKSTDILSIDGITCSKSPIDKYADLNEFSLTLKEDAKKIYKNNSYIEFNTTEDFEKNCSFARKELHKHNSIIVQQWNRRKYILNTNSSHHLAAIYRQCKEQGREYPLNLDIVFEIIDKRKLSDILNNYYIIFSDKSNLDKIALEYDKVFGVTSHKLIEYKNYEGNPMVILLRKDNKINGIIYAKLIKYREKFLLLNEALERLYL